ncbi:hypothetical protein BH09GEM1_BH09GEM1_45140 [soil metagenome]
MTPERWAELEPLVDAMLDCPRGAREAYVDRIRATDPALAADLARLLAQGDDHDSLFDRAAAERGELLRDDSRAGVVGDLRTRIQESVGTSYALEDELSRGGMSRVFIAREAGLARRVVIKLLAPELAKGISAERFEREIRLLAVLQQANIVPLLTAGRAAGLPYYTMPLVEGRSLRDRLLRDGPLSIGDGVSVLRDIARALAYAHERGVAHRDIKPANVLLSGGTAVVIDFGIAKALTEALIGADPEQLTAAGTMLGTPAYMSPEQAAGDPRTDHRTDIYSFGCVAYEVFAGQPPFHGLERPQIIAAHLYAQPVALANHRTNLPAAISALIEKCLEKDAARRPQSASELLSALERVDVRTIEPTPTRIERKRLAMTAIAVAIAVAVGLWVTSSWRG